MLGLLDDIEQLDFSDYSEMLFNLYEDEKAYTVEVVFDDDKLIIGRDDQRYVIEERNVDFNVVLKNVALILKTYFKEKKDIYKQFKSIAYGFVDGDLYYIKKPRKNIDTWKFAHEYCGSLWFKAGFVLLIPTIVAQIPFAKSSDSTVGWVTIVIEIINKLKKRYPEGFETKRSVVRLKGDL